MSAPSAVPQGIYGNLNFFIASPVVDNLSRATPLLRLFQAARNVLDSLYQLDNHQVSLITQDAAQLIEAPHTPLLRLAQFTLAIAAVVLCVGVGTWALFALIAIPLLLRLSYADVEIVDLNEEAREILRCIHGDNEEWRKGFLHLLRDQRAPAESVRRELLQACRLEGTSLYNLLEGLALGEANNASAEVAARSFLSLKHLLPLQSATFTYCMDKLSQSLGAQLYPNSRALLLSLPLQDADALAMTQVYLELVQGANRLATQAKIEVEEAFWDYQRAEQDNPFALRTPNPIALLRAMSDYSPAAGGNQEGFDIPSLGGIIGRARTNLPNSFACRKYVMYRALLNSRQLEGGETVRIRHLNELRELLQEAWGGKLDDAYLEALTAAETFLAQEIAQSPRHSSAQELPQQASELLHERRSELPSSLRE